MAGLWQELNKLRTCVRTCDTAIEKKTASFCTKYYILASWGIECAKGASPVRKYTYHLNIHVAGFELNGIFPSETEGRKINKVKTVSAAPHGEAEG
jgi:hypothetical protein